LGRAFWRGPSITVSQNPKTPDSKDLNLNMKSNSKTAWQPSIRLAFVTKLQIKKDQVSIKDYWLSLLIFIGICFFIQPAQC